jgi:NAD(P)H-hydrate epimerase
VADETIVTAIPPIKWRPVDMHKGDAGAVFCVAGSVGMAGAAAMSARAALRCGTGLVRVGMPWRLAAVMGGRDPNLMTAALPETDDGTINALAAPKILKAAEGFDTMLIGPGLSTNPQTVQCVLTLLPQAKLKLVIDADALNAIAHDKCRVLKDISRDNGLPILTPHPGEMQRLMGKEADLRRDDNLRREAAAGFARKHKVLLVLKGHRTVVTDGKRVYFNTTGNPGMAVAGMGDVLCGAIAGFVAQGYAAFEAACLGAYIHGLAGDIVRDRMGEIGLIATDVIEELPEAARRHQALSPKA